MSDSRFACTVDNRQGIWPDPGMLGRGYAAFAYESEPYFRGGPRIDGYYPVSDYDAALFLAYELADPDIVMGADEALEKANLLQNLLQGLQRAGRWTLEELSTLQKAAERIPEIGPLLFSPTSLPGTFVTAGSIVAAASMSKPTHQLLDLTNARKKALYQWSQAKGKARVQAAQRLAQGRVTLVTHNGKHQFKVPVTAQASHYLVAGKVPGSTILVPAHSARASLVRKAMLSANGASGALRMATGTTAGALLAIGPQAVTDYMNATGFRDFLRRSTYSQPGNIAAVAASLFVANALAGVLASSAARVMPLLVLLLIGGGVGLAVQNLMNRFEGNKMIVDYFWD
jgi:hypothetical protein